MSQIIRQRGVGIVMRFKRRRLWRRRAESRIDTPGKLRHGIVVFVFGSFRVGIVDITADEVDILGGLRDLLASTTLVYESDNVSPHVHALQREANFLASSIVANANCRGDIGIRPKAVLCKVEPLFLKVLKLVGSGLPLSVPSDCGLLQYLDGILIFRVRSREADLRLLQLGFVSTLFLTHHHVALCEITFNFQAFLFIFVPSLVKVSRGTFSIPRVLLTLFTWFVC